MTSASKCITVVVASAAALAIAAPTAHAASASISPGDRIDYITDEGSASFCTVGYVYTGSDGHAYAITAGHCETDDPGHVVDGSATVAGRFVDSLVAPPRSGGADYGLIDFGPNVTSRPVIGDDIAVAAAEPPAVEIGQTVCRLGVSSGEHCGTVAYRYGDEQLMTTDMPASVPGDSGGPVWIVDDNGQAHIVGIWLGDKAAPASGHRYGRFARLTAALDTLA
jgi:streptogrisin B